MGRHHLGLSCHGDPDGTTILLEKQTFPCVRVGFIMKVKNPSPLADDLVSVGRGTPLLLNVPPTKEGLLAEVDVQCPQEFHQLISLAFTMKTWQWRLKSQSSSGKGRLSSKQFWTDGQRIASAPNAEETPMS